MGSLRRLASRTRAPRWRGRVRRPRPAPRPTPASVRIRVWRAHRERWLLRVGNAALAAGDVGTALDATAAAWEHGSFSPGFAAHLRPIIALAALAGGDLIAARRWADDAVATAPGWAVLIRALTARARVAIAQVEPEQAERDAHDALARALPKV